MLQFRNPAALHVQQIFMTWYVAYNKHCYIVAKYIKSAGNEGV